MMSDMTKAIFFDVDGTLLNDSHQILTSTKKVIKTLNDKGLLISLVTARPPQATQNYCDELGIVANPMICFNGAFITKSNQILFDANIPLNIANKIIEISKSYDVTVNYYSGFDWYVEKIDKYVQNEMDITHTKPSSIIELCQISLPPNKILINGESEILDKLTQKLKRDFEDDLHIKKSKPTYLEINAVGISKEVGIKKILNKFNIKKDEIIVFGDNFNDLDMFDLAKISVAMGNAPSEVKDKAAFVTDSNNNDGIAKFLIKYFNLN